MRPRENPWGYYMRQVMPDTLMGIHSDRNLMPSAHFFSYPSQLMPHLAAVSSQATAQSVST